MSKSLEESVRTRLRWARYIFFAAFSVAILGLLLAENVRPGTFLYNLVGGSILISAISGIYIGIVAAWNYTLGSDE